VRRSFLLTLVGIVSLYFLFLYGLTDVGMLGPDEPRYASIGREMAFTGDWVTPNLWGRPWFEKPVLLYWITGAGFSLGLDEELAPRLPVALLSICFLVFFQWRLSREFGSRAAWYAATILATSAGWFAYSHLCVTDVPMAAFFGAAVILLLPWVRDGNRNVVFPAGACLGCAMLAKGLVPAVLFAPLLWFGRRRWRDLFAFGCFAVLAAAPWYILCTLVNGPMFVEEFFWKHHFARFASESLQHVQPFWFYGPILLAGFVPWSPLLLTMFSRKQYSDKRRLFLLLTVLFGLLFFSVSTNKLPGYLLPLFPPLAALAGIRLAEMKSARPPLVLAAILLLVIPVAAAILPDAVRAGLSRSVLPVFPWWVFPPTAVAAVLVWWFELNRKRDLAVLTLVIGVTAGVVYLKATAFPVLDKEVSVRSFWREHSVRIEHVCIDQAHRNVVFGLNYYAFEPLPTCQDEPRPFRVWQKDAEPPTLLTLPSYHK